MENLTKCLFNEILLQYIDWTSDFKVFAPSSLTVRSPWKASIHATSQFKNISSYPSKTTINVLSTNISLCLTIIECAVLGVGDSWPGLLLQQGLSRDLRRPGRRALQDPVSKVSGTTRYFMNEIIFHRYNRVGSIEAVV